ncbi:hypothetical protein BKA82DRAFT_1005564 [Pisolithus tinctorius]|uniref:Uncharacterized protein n=1 Tax=Pisolithus tinctorius Marx 270 TaxID=870435 RepID=A0A0C3NSE1_PISTI|nr:hypothetical protein BKA82DRAFT_1005564 [Pisolithus tinctorius]KIN98198.1 hypothetical protein M404DRAFT_1005564 [Pisolithus tinctorius Marx 270]
MPCPRRWGQVRAKKPTSKAHNSRMLLDLNGGVGEVLSGVSLGAFLLFLLVSQCPPPQSDNPSLVDIPNLNSHPPSNICPLCLLNHYLSHLNNKTKTLPPENPVVSVSRDLQLTCQFIG